MRFRRSLLRPICRRRSIGRLQPTLSLNCAGLQGLPLTDARLLYTGACCIEWAGHLVEPRFAVQGNMLANAEVLPAMRRAFLDTGTRLPERYATA